MTSPVLLIAGREFRAYVATASFWIALSVGPLLLAGAVALTTATSRPVPAAKVAIVTDDRRLFASAEVAVLEAARIEGRTLVITPDPKASTWRLQLDARRDGGVAVRMQGTAALSPAGQSLVTRTLERDMAVARLRALGQSAPPATIAQVPEDTARPGPDAAALSRFSVVMLLWLTLTGSLGMLLQAVVRERANRALEALLAAARPWQIVVGKVAGVGAVSMFVLGAWLGSAAALAPLAPADGGLAAAILHGLAAPAMLARAAVIYVLAFAFYGLVTVAVSGTARDTAAAQNLSRPMFALLLAAFFAALTATGGMGAGLGWLVYAPPFTPFMLLLQAPGQMSLGHQMVALALLVAAALAAAGQAVRALSLESGPTPWPKLTKWAGGAQKRARLHAAP